MASADLAVVVEVARPDGSQEQVRIGTARRDGGVFVLDLGALKISALEQRVNVPASAPPAPGGTIEDLEYIAARARRTLADTSKSRWHSQERDLLNQVETEMTRLRALGKPD
jgi:hypothetical protein